MPLTASLMSHPLCFGKIPSTGLVTECFLYFFEGQAACGQFVLGFFFHICTYPSNELTRIFHVVGKCAFRRNLSRTLLQASISKDQANECFDAGSRFRTHLHGLSRGNVLVLLPLGLEGQVGEVLEPKVRSRDRIENQSLARPLDTK